MVPDRVEELHELGAESGVDILGELIEIFKETAPGRITSMRAALVSKDWKLLEREAHTLKSSAGNLGLSRLQESCKDIGYALPDRNTSHIEGLIASIGNELQLSLVELANTVARLTYKAA
jgi:HPt (histidine-containing phosphotransfer) domain-containing protein